MLFIQKAKKQGYYLKYHERAMASTIDPLKEASRLLESIDQLENNVFILCLGVGPLYHLEYFKKHSHVILMEPRFDRETLEETLKDSHLSSLFEDSPVKILQDITSLEKQIFNMELDQIKIIDCLRSEEWDDWKKKILMVIQKRVRSNQTTQYFQKRWLKNSLNHLEHFNSQYLSDFSIKKLSEKKAYVFLSTGCFLEEDLSFLRDNREFFYIIAHPSTLRVLDEVQLEPDLLVSTDGGFYNDYHFHYLYESGKRLPLIAPLSIQSHISHYYQGDIYFYLDQERVLKSILTSECILEETKEAIGFQYIPMDGSVSISILYLFKYWGLQKVWMSGVSFNFDAFKYHCLGNKTEELLFQRTQYLRSFETEYEELYFRDLTPQREFFKNNTLELYRQQFEKICSHLKINVGELKKWDGSLEKAVVPTISISSKKLTPILQKNYQILMDRTE